MPNQPVYENLFCNQRIIKKEEKIKAESKTEVLSDSVAKIISLSADALLTDKAIEQNKVSYNGKAVFFLCYEDKDGAILKTECGVEYKGAVQFEEDISNVNIVPEIERVEADVSGVKLAVKCYITIKITARTHCLQQTLIDGDDLICKKTTVPFVKSFGVKMGNYVIDEQVDLDYKIEEVINHSLEVRVSSVSSGVGVIIVDGEGVFSQVLLQSDEKNSIIKEKRSFPFRAEIECEEAMPSLVSTASVGVKSFKTDIVVDEEKNKSQVNVYALLSLEGEAFIKEEKEVVLDAFMTTHNITVERTNGYVYSPMPLKEQIIHFEQNVAVDELPQGATNFEVAYNKCNVISCNKENDVIKVEGVINVTGVMQIEGKLVPKKIETPFIAEISDIEGENCYTRQIIDNIEIKANTSTEITLTYDLCFTVYSEQKEEFSVISKYNVVREKTKNEHAISVYIPVCGEELWDLAKRLGITPSVLAETNPDLQFPLSGNERIVVYRQLENS